MSVTAACRQRPRLPLPAYLAGLTASPQPAVVRARAGAAAHLDPSGGACDRAALLGWRGRLTLESMVRSSLPDDVADALRKYRELLAAHFGARLESVRLFGSRARGDHEPGSDADVAVIIAALTEPERTLAIDLAMEAWRSSGRGPVLLMPLVWSSAEFAERLASERRIAADVLREGIEA